MWLVFLKCPVEIYTSFRSHLGSHNTISLLLGRITTFRCGRPRKNMHVFLMPTIVICDMNLHVSQWTTHHVGCLLIEVVVTNCAPNTIVEHFYTSTGFAITIHQAECWQHERVIIHNLHAHFINHQKLSIQKHCFNIHTVKNGIDYV